MIYLPADPLLMADLFSGSGFQISLATADPGTNEPTYLLSILFSFLPAFARFRALAFLRGKWYLTPRAAEEEPGSRVPSLVLWNQPAVWLWATDLSFLPFFFFFYLLSYLSVNRRDGLHGLSENLWQLPHEMLLRKLNRYGVKGKVLS